MSLEGWWGEVWDPGKPGPPVEPGRGVFGPYFEVKREEEERGEGSLRGEMFSEEEELKLEGIV